ncbi:mitotic-spindle organizing protein 2-like [Oratosquilla oratoria]|uniref:mitotic-spindle organizing protein 2-like n=1 Tax=Oratosquilla oratoria TaxID=337810 RepID=UPI003F7731B3
MSESHNFTILTRNNLTREQLPLYDLAREAGIEIHPKIFKSILELLSLNVPPHTLLGVLHELWEPSSVMNDTNSNEITEVELSPRR